jgi:hypothetical protein
MQSQSYKNEINGKQTLLMQSLTTFFSDPSNLETLLSILHTDSDSISLRIIDWFVTNYTKENEIIYENKQSFFNVYDNYKSQLKAYSKRQFDPFCRRTRINFYYTNEDKIKTTVGQLNFFRWAIENGVIDYLRNNLKDIEGLMKQDVKIKRETKKNLKRKTTPSSAVANEEQEETEQVENTSLTRRRNFESHSKRRNISKHKINTVLSFL